VSGRFDVVVAGLGVVGSAAASELARRGLSVAGLDRGSPPHDLGSSHGETRMIREAYFEHPLYVPLVRRAYDGWRALEERSGRRLLFETGGILAGAPAGELVGGALASAGRHGIEVERLDQEDALLAYPGLRLPSAHALLREARAGYLLAEPCVEALLDAARDAGAELRTGETVEGWDEDGTSGLLVRSSSGDLACGTLVLAAGAWTPSLCGLPSLPLLPVRMTQHWFRPSGGTLDPRELPVFLLELDPGRIAYGFPDLGGGVKAAFHHGGVPCAPDRLERGVRRAEARAVAHVMERYFPGSAWRPVRSAACMYTLTPDRHFVVDRHPRSPRVIVAGGFSGHGFKFAPALGSIVAGLAAGSEPAFDLSPFRIGRF